MSFILRILGAAVALWVAMQVVPGITINAEGTKYWGTLVVVALIFGVINAIVKPIVKGLGCLFIVLTLGLFLLVINAGMLLLTSWVAGLLDVPFHVDNFYPSAFWGSIIISVVTWVLGLFTKD